MASVRDDDVVGQVYVHGLAFHEFRQSLVVVTGVRVAGGMVVDKGYLCGVAAGLRAGCRARRRWWSCRCR